MRKIDVIGKKFGKITAIKEDERRGRHIYIACVCDCGNQKSIRKDSLIKGSTKSCGCSQGRTAIDISGRRFGKLVAISIAPKKERHLKWICQCDCGNIKEIRASHLVNGSNKSCGCQKHKRKSRDLKGLRFNRLVVLKRVDKVNKDIRWLCRCDCGNEKDIDARHLTSSKGVKSCGCLLEEHIKKITLPEGEASFRRLYRGYKRSSPGRGLSFELTTEEFRRITSSKCFYCGSLPSYEMKPQIYTNGSYIYNGVDRVDNDRGYESDNCVPCCFVCNTMKKAHSIDYFMAHIKKIYENISESSIS